MTVRFRASIRRTATGPNLRGAGLTRTLMIVSLLVTVVFVTAFFLSRKRAKRVVKSTPAAATLVKTDTVTQGSWKGVYGANGVAIANDATRFPEYVEITVPSQNVSTWDGSTSAARALQKVAGPDRIASCWWGWSSVVVDLNLTDGEPHEVAVYFLDGDSAARSQIVDVLDPVTGNVLDSRAISKFVNGQYLVWNMSGHVNIRLTRVDGANAVLSGLFVK
jgi:hypothetical protein